MRKAAKWNETSDSGDLPGRGFFSLLLLVIGVEDGWGLGLRWMSLPSKGQFLEGKNTHVPHKGLTLNAWNVLGIRRPNLMVLMEALANGYHWCQLCCVS